MSPPGLPFSLIDSKRSSEMDVGFGDLEDDWVICPRSGPCAGLMPPTLPPTGRPNTDKEQGMTDTITEMLDAHPGENGLDQRLLTECIRACIDCAQTCTTCADACLGEESVGDLARCIRSDLDCADVCVTTARVLSRGTASDAALTRAVLQACAQACRSCSAECAQHAEMHEHCRICAEACRRCEEACNRLFESL